MALDYTQLATDMRNAMGFSGPLSQQILGLAQGIVEEVSSGIFSHSSVTGTAPIAGSGAPLQNGAASGGIIVGLSGSSLASKVQGYSGFPTISVQLTQLCTQITTHILTGTVEFASGDITGQCMNLPPAPPILPIGAPGPLVAGAGTNGTILGLNGPTLAQNIHSAMGFPGSVSAYLIAMSTAITTHIMNNAEGTYMTSSIVGVCPAGGGSLVGGSAVGGTLI